MALSPRALLACSLTAFSLLASAGSAAAIAPPTYSGPLFGDFRSVLAQGEGQTANAGDVAAYVGAGTVPPSFVSQQPLYVGGVQFAKHTSAADLDRYYKGTNFGSMPGGVASLVTPRLGVRIYRDRDFGMAHIYGDTRGDVMFGAGYATATERLFLMDALRRTAKGTLAGILGPSAAAGDASQLTDQDFSPAELTAQFDALPSAFGAEGARAHTDLLDYVDGINAYITEARSDPSKMPGEYAALGATPAPWTTSDTAALAVLLVTQFTVSNGSEQVNAMLQQGFKRQFGEHWRAPYHDFRSAEDGEAYTVAKQPFPSDRPGPIKRSLNARPGFNSVFPRNTLVSGPSRAQQAEARSGLPDWAARLLGLRASFPPDESNAVMVTNKLSKGPHPLAAMGPQVSYYSPQIFSEYELHGGGIDVEGVSFPGASPYPLIGHGIDFAWSGTSANGDNEDTYLERLCNPDGSIPSSDSTHYIYKGRCRAFTSRDQSVRTPVSPLDPTTPPQTITYRTLRSVHGPVFAYAKVHGDPVALAKAKGVDFHELDAVVAFMRLAENKVTDINSFFDTMGTFPGTENWFYVDHVDTGFIQSGRYPAHTPGSNVDLPYWGDGRADWQQFDPSSYTFKTIPPSHRPRAINPPQGFVVSWNNKEAPGWRKGPREWSNGPVHHALILEHKLLEQVKAGGGKVDLAGLTRAVNLAASTDLRGDAIFSLMRQVIGTPPANLKPQLRLIRLWRRSGSNRLDANGDNLYDHGAAVALIDAWWPRFIQASYEPGLGPDLYALVESRVLGTGGFGWDWASAVSKDLRLILGRPEVDPHSRIYCGGPGALPTNRAERKRARTACRTVLLDTFRAAIAAVAADQGSSDPADWRVLATCNNPGEGPCDQIEPNTAGAIDTPPFPWQNRGTYHQIIEVKGHR